MKWIRYKKDYEIQVGILEKEGIISLSNLGYNFADVNDVIQLKSEEYKRVLSDIQNYSGALDSINNVEILAPIHHPTQDILCVGLNYDEHQKEANQYEENNFPLNHEATIYFSKRVNEIRNSQSDIYSHPTLTSKFDYETELAVILKEDCKECDLSTVQDKIFGYTVINDYSARDLQTKHQQWYVGKSLDGSFSMSEAIVSKDEIEDDKNLKIKTIVNGELRQSSSTHFMIKSVDKIIVELSQWMTLKKGTIIATGTPSGVGMGLNPPTFLKAGDVVVSEIDKVGTIRNKII